MKNKPLLLLAILAVFMVSPAAFCCTMESFIGDLVWNDLNQDGIRDDGEPGLADVRVDLYHEDDTYYDSTTTDANGGFGFTMPAGDYYVQFVLPKGYVFSLQNQGVDNTIDSDADVSTGLTIPTRLDAGESDTTWDAGMHTVPIPGGIWLLGSGLVGLVGFRGKRKKSGHPGSGV